MIGWALTFLSAIGNSTNDVFKKTLISYNLISYESMFLMNVFGAFLNLLYFFIFEQPIQDLKYSSFMFANLMTSISKILAQYCYFNAVENAPLSAVIPYLALNPVFLLVMGFFFLGENPSPISVSGCLTVLLGAYFIALDAKKKQILFTLKKQDEIVVSFTEEEDEDNLKILNNNIERRHKAIHLLRKLSSRLVEGRLVSLIKNVLRFKGGMYMLGVAVCWTYSSATEKYVMNEFKTVPVTFFLGTQRIMMAIPCMFITLYRKPTFLKILKGYKINLTLLIAASLESLTVIFYLNAIKTIFVSYVIAIKRAGNIFISTLLGRYLYKEELSFYLKISCASMVLGVILVVLGDELWGN